MTNTPPSSREPIPGSDRFTSCYGCGKDNPRGLHMHFERDGSSVVCDWTPPLELGGYGRILHGGVTATLLDEAFGWALYGLKDKLGLTTEMQITLSASIYCGEPLVLRASIDAHDERYATLRSIIHNHRGKLAATGIGKMRYVSRRLVEKMGNFVTE